MRKHTAYLLAGWLVLSSPTHAIVSVSDLLNAQNLKSTIKAIFDMKSTLKDMENLQEKELKEMGKVSIYYDNLRQGDGYIDILGDYVPYEIRKDILTPDGWSKQLESVLGIDVYEQVKKWDGSIFSDLVLGDIGLSPETLAAVAQIRQERRRASQLNHSSKTNLNLKQQGQIAEYMAKSADINEQMLNVMTILARDFNTQAKVDEVNKRWLNKNTTSVPSQWLLLGR